MERKAPTGRAEGPRSAGRFSDIPTRWSRLQAAPRDALDYLFRTYGTAIRSYTSARLARGDFGPLREGDTDDLLQDFFLRLGTSGWLAKPDRTKGRFRPYLVRRLVFFLRERRAAALGRASRAGPAGDAELEAVATDDPLELRFEEEWRDATVKECLRLLAARSADQARVLDAHLGRGDRDDADVAAELGLSVDSFRSHLKRARAEFRRLFAAAEARLDEPPEGTSPR